MNHHPFEEQNGWKTEESISSLPPRSTVHSKKKTKTKWKVQYPLLRFLLFFFILLPITIFSIYTYWQHDEETIPASIEKGGKKVTVDALPIETDKEMNLEEEPAFPSVSLEELSEKMELRSAEEQSTLSISSPKESEKEHAEPKYHIVYHTVQPEETLYRISMNYFHSKEGIDIIKRWNGLNDNEIKVGQVLQIPLPRE
ncbi:LysM peptidoglycan-binding domain-containing protein [Aeribacillus pallidus]|uniref:LysM peptidoglycan-binding domain-containing protein n=1 Tax=Aeribacillus pallidus TaxID=33936 RepID=UPI003D1CB6E6